MGRIAVVAGTSRAPVGSLADVVCFIALQPQLVAQSNAPSSCSAGWVAAGGSFDGSCLCAPAALANLVAIAAFGAASFAVSVWS